MEVLFWLSFIAVGALAGFAGGIMGISGGIITVPCLFYLFSKYSEIPKDQVMLMAIGTSLASMLFNAWSSLIAYNKKNLVEWQLFKKLGISVIIGCVIGSIFAKFLPAFILKKFFGVFLIFVCLLLLKPRGKDKSFKIEESHNYTHFIGSCIGMLSNILGVGGGIMTLPLFLHWGMDEKKAAGTSSAFSFLITLIGAIVYLVIGVFSEKTPHSLGYIYLPAFFFISIFSYLVAPLSVSFAMRLSPLVLRKIFAALLFLLSIKMLWID